MSNWLNMSEPSSPCTPPLALPNGRFASTIVVDGSFTPPTLQSFTWIEPTCETEPTPAIRCRVPVVRTPSSRATCESTSEVDAPVSSANEYGPWPSILTGTTASTCLPCFSTLIATKREPFGASEVCDLLVPPQPAARRAASAAAASVTFTLVQRVSARKRYQR